MLVPIKTELIPNIKKYLILYPELYIFFRNLMSIELTVTGECNLMCRYCYFTDWRKRHKTNLYKKEYMDEKIGLNSIDVFEKLLEAKHKILNNDLDKIYNIELFGGDPMLYYIHNKDGFIKILERCRDSKYNLGVSMPINGMYGQLSNDNDFRKFIDCYRDIFLFSLSVDGNKNIQEYNRPYNMETMRKLQLIPEGNPDMRFFKMLDELKIPYGCHPMLTGKSIKNPHDVLGFFVEDLGIRDSMIGMLQARCNHIFEDIDYSDMENFAKVSIEYYRKYGLKSWMFDYVSNMKSGYEMMSKRAFTCSIFNSIYIDIDGDIHLCHRFKLIDNNKDRYKIGYINDEDMYIDFDKLFSWITVSQKQKTKCHSCLFKWPGCGGDCFAHTMENYPTCADIDDNICRSNRMMIYAGLKIHNILGENDE